MCLLLRLCFCLLWPIVLALCPDGFEELDGGCYKLIDLAAEVESANDDCGQLASGGKLIDLETEDELQMLSSWLMSESNIGSYLTGGYGTISEGYWWSTGSLVPYDGQELNQPGQPVCIILTAKTRTVRDEDCHQWPYVCEAPTIASPVAQEPTLTTTEPRVTTSESTLTTTEPRVTTSESTLTTLEQRVTTSESTLTTLEQKVTTSESTLTTTEPRGRTSESTRTTETGVAEAPLDTENHLGTRYKVIYSEGSVEHAMIRHYTLVNSTSEAMLQVVQKGFDCRSAARRILVYHDENDVDKSFGKFIKCPLKNIVDYPETGLQMCEYHCAHSEAFRRVLLRLMEGSTPVLIAETHIYPIIH